MSPTDRTAREGLVVGGLAYLAVAVCYACFDILAARGAFFTLNLLGRALFRGLRDPAVLQLPVQADVPAMLLYNGVHFVISLVLGTIVARLVARAERSPVQAPLAGYVIVAGFVITILGIGILTASFRPLLPWWSIVAANTLAVLVAGTYLLRRHPGIWHRLMPALGHAGAAV